MFLLMATRMQANTNLADLEGSVEFVNCDLSSALWQDVMITITLRPFPEAKQSELLPGL